MYGPQEIGHWSRGGALQDRYAFLVAGRRYRVTREFADFDGDSHAVGEEWTFLGASFLPHDDGLSLFVSLDGSREWQIRMQLDPDAQGRIVRALSDYVGPA
jgi:hypothetical protein